MALTLIGAGLGRTGTKSLQTALNLLGVGPCHHMVDVLTRPETIPLWIAAGEGRPDWETIYAGYASAVDYPTAFFWRELAEYYPDAKILLTVRDPEAWFASTQATIFAPDGLAVRSLTSDQGPMAGFFRTWARPLAGHLNDREFLIDYFNRHNEAVKAEIPAERLLVYESGQGWEPLSRFLGVPVPDAPYPSENSRADFAARTAKIQADLPK